jgi:hypothetical protein
MTRRRKFVLAGVLGGLFATLGVGQAVLDAATDAQSVQAPRCLTSGCWAPRSASAWIPGTTSSSSTAGIPR